MKNRRIGLFISFFAITLILFTAATLNIISIPDNVKVICNNSSIRYEDKDYKSNFLYKIDSNRHSEAISCNNNLEKLDVCVKLFGVIPVKKVTLNIAPEVKLIPGGQPIGVKLYTNGVLVVGFSDVETTSGKKQSPAAEGGIEIGDSIIEVNNHNVKDSQELSRIVNSNKDKNLNIKVNRKNKMITVNVKAIETKNAGEYKIGLWVRDSTAGVGTLTFYEPNSGEFGALGHPINDVDTGSLLSVKDGKIYNANIVSVEQGVRGKPGELRGMFSDEDEIGILEKNTTEGIYGKIKEKVADSDYSKPLKVARQDEIQEGPAKILTSINGCSVKAYDVYIEKTTEQSKPNSKSMVIKVTDKELLAKTGGIVQGMSGSPIIQNDKIIGAVTHVFVNRPDMGYGIYIEWMLQQAGLDK